MTDIAPGWPCALLPSAPPSVSDRLAAPTADDILPQLLQLTPRGPAWGTDEAGSGQGAQPIMLAVWRAIAGHAASNYAIDFSLATQCFPSAITFSLADWEAEYGLPDLCSSGQVSTDQRGSAVRARFGAIGGQSPAYFVCLAASIGYDITIEEPGQFLCDDSECAGTGTYEGWFICDDGVCDDTPLESYALDTDTDPDNHDDEVSDETVWKYWIVHVQSLGETWFYPDDGEVDYDPIEGFLTAIDLECVLRRVCPPHTQLVFDYLALPLVASFDFSIPGNPAIVLL
ncbi:DUF2313 domain-containing protein [Lichenihabitans sp. PAMC28606]|uniref:putative phage tail protein n=1 Tax=Lichenihabitans sp. PAMC28606 TaxID=2880932 RepID=UPI001D0A2C4E|nr:putative phage tail protein [Lichenihabitans sp. PAMC28606]UDL95515.1 DUF2313 domain-containing protein [Lichenihabitans sp. PAMC28606]